MLALDCQCRDPWLGAEWDPWRPGYTLHFYQIEGIAYFRAVGARVSKFADMPRDFGTAAAVDSDANQARQPRSRSLLLCRALNPATD